VGSLTLQIPHSLQIPRQTHLLTVQALLLLGEAVEGTVLPLSLSGVLSGTPEGVCIRVAGFYGTLGIGTVQLGLLLFL
jgi:hypothetical protein